MHAEAAGLPVERFVLHDPPYSPDDADARAEARSFATNLTRLLAEDRRAEALTTFFRGVGMPEPAIADLRTSPSWPGLLTLAPMLSHRVVEGQDHVVDPRVLAPLVAEFLRS